MCYILDFNFFFWSAYVLDESLDKNCSMVPKLIFWVRWGGLVTLLNLIPITNVII